MPIHNRCREGAACQRPHHAPLYLRNSLLSRQLSRNNRYLPRNRNPQLHQPRRRFQKRQRPPPMFLALECLHEAAAPDLRQCRSDRRSRRRRRNQWERSSRRSRSRSKGDEGLQRH